MSKNIVVGSILCAIGIFGLTHCDFLGGSQIPKVLPTQNPVEVPPPISPSAVPVTPASIPYQTPIVSPTPLAPRQEEQKNNGFEVDNKIWNKLSLEEREEIASADRYLSQYWGSGNPGGRQELNNMASTEFAKYMKAVVKRKGDLKELTALWKNWQDIRKSPGLVVSKDFTQATQQLGNRKHELAIQ